MHVSIVGLSVWFCLAGIFGGKDEDVTLPHFFPYGRLQFEETLVKLNNSLPKRKRKLQTDSSPNLFIENLHTTRGLETVHYVTDAKQMTDFFWFRDSGIRINVGLQNVQVIPQFKEVDHKGDSEFELTKPVGRDVKLELFKKSFTKITQHLCRNPIPEKYRLNLEIFKDRLTSAKSEICDLKTLEEGQCPQSAVLGGEFVLRSLDEPCVRLNTYPSRLSSANNSIVCHSDTPLFTTVFGFQSPPVRTSHPDSKSCKAALQKCHKCLDHDHCQSEDEVERSCCQVDCHSLPECKTAFSVRCTRPSVDCASGDVHRFTVQPIFHLHPGNGSFTSYKCHLKRIHPVELYQVWFYVTVPSANVSFETPRVHFKAKLGEDTAELNHQQFQFLLLEHGFGIGRDRDDVILEAEVDLDRMVDDEGEKHGRFTITPSDEFENLFQDQSGQSKGVVNTFVRDIRFTRPFSYSSSAWTKDGCDKNMSLISLVDVADEGNVKTSSKLEVNAMTQDARKPLEYLLKSVDNPPFIRLSVPGTSSVIRWWFSEGNVSLLFKETLQVSLTSEDSNRFWKFSISGQMTTCPAYLGLTINDLTEFEEVAKLDILVSCPPSFTFNVLLPNWSHRSEKTFEVITDDAHRQYFVYLSSTRIGIKSESDRPNFAPPRASSINTESRETVQLASSFLYLIIVIWIVHAVVNTAGRSNFCWRKSAEQCFCDRISLKELRGEIFLDCRKTSRPMVVTYYSKSEEKDQPLSRKKFISCYVIFRVVFVVLFTFTAAFFLAYFCLPSVFESKNQTAVNCSQRDQKDFNFRDLKTRKIVNEDVKLCENYVEGLVEEMKEASRKLEIFSDEYFLQANKFPFKGPYQQLLRETFGQLLRDFENSAREQFSGIVSKLESNTVASRSKMIFNPWLSYLRALIRHQLAFSGKVGDERVQLEEMFAERLSGNFSSSITRVQNYTENERSEKLRSIKLERRTGRPFISTRYFSSQSLPSSVLQHSSWDKFSGSPGVVENLGVVIAYVFSEAVNASLFLPLLIVFDCCLILIRLNGIGDVLAKIKRTSDRFFVEDKNLFQYQHPSNPPVANFSSNESNSPRFKCQDKSRDGGGKTSLTSDLYDNSPKSKIVSFSSYETLVRKSSPKANNCLLNFGRCTNVSDVRIYRCRWKFDEAREHLATLSLRTQHSTASPPHDSDRFKKSPERGKELKRSGRKGRVMVRTAVKFVFLMFSTSVLIFFIIILWFVVESARAALVDFENRGILIPMGNEEVEPFSGHDDDYGDADDDLSVDLQLFVSSSADKFLTEIMTLDELIQSVHKNYTHELKSRHDELAKLSLRFQDLTPVNGRKLFIPSTETSLRSAKCLHCQGHAPRSTLVCPCSFRKGDDEPQSQTPQKRALIDCRWSFIESFRTFSSEFLARSKILFIICIILVWLESVVRLIFVVISRKIKLIKTNCLVRVARVALSSDFEQDRLDCRPEILSNAPRESKNADLFVIELNKSLSANNFSDSQARVQAAVGLRFSETKV